jgi:membrane protease YdiL (CAAX protease family)
VTGVVQTKAPPVSPLGLMGLGLAIVAFPIFKVQVVEHLPAIVRYSETGRGSGWYVWAACYIGAEAVIAALCLASILRERRRPADAGLNVPASRVWWLVLAVFLIAGAIVIALRHVDVITIMGAPGEDYGAVAARNTAQRIVAVLTSAIVVPMEEFIWRGFAITRLQRLGLPTWAAVVVPSLAFGYFHGGTIDTIWITGFIAAAVAVLGVMYLRTRSLAWPILIHFSWNVMILSLTPTPV